jgi:hypothetical protein
VKFRRSGTKAALPVMPNVFAGLGILQSEPSILFDAKPTII